jgi:hypothetical protein
MSNIATAGTAGNVVSIFRGPARPRLVDPTLSSFLKHVNVEMYAQSGVHYLALKDDLHGGDFDVLRTYLETIDLGKDATDDERTSAFKALAEEAVDDFMRDHGLRHVDEDVSIDATAAYNRVKAAISNFVGTGGDWHRAAGGQVYRRLEDGVAFMFPVPYRKDSPNEQDQCGFGVDYREGAIVDEYTHEVEAEGESVARMRRSDICDVVEALDACVTNRLENGKFAY